MHRHDAPAAWNGFSADVVYQGRVANDRLISATVNGNPVPDINLAWGFALESLPGSNAERDRRQSAQVQAQALAVHSESPPGDVEPAVDVDLSTADAPPPLLNYEQTPCPEEGYLWTPGYWNWSAAGYYWVRGAWVLPPRMAVLWTPGYWGYAGGVYAFHPGYWGPHVGFYGGVNYGFGYVGAGLRGALGSVIHLPTIGSCEQRRRHRHHTDTYNEAVVNDAARRNVSYNGGPGGTMTAATMQERAAAAEPHIPPTAQQHQTTQQG